MVGLVVGSPLPRPCSFRTPGLRPLGRGPCPPSKTLAEFTTQRPKCAFTPLCEYYPATEILVVEFTAYRKALAPPPLTGRPYIYFYENVPVAVANDWFAQDCDGVDYNFVIRGQPGPEYPYTRVT